MFESLNTPFFHGLALGLALGLGLACWTWLTGWLRRRDLRLDTGKRVQAVNEELEKLRQHLHTQMQITAKGTEEQQFQLTKLRVQNENLRVMVQGLQQKPERAHLRTLEVWQRAIDRMAGRAPGFSAAWQQSVTEAETELAESESGLTRFVRKFLGPSRPPGPAGTVDPAPKQEIPEA